MRRVDPEAVSDRTLTSATLLAQDGSVPLQTAFSPSAAASNPSAPLVSGDSSTTSHLLMPGELPGNPDRATGTPPQVASVPSAAGALAAEHRPYVPPHKTPSKTAQEQYVEQHEPPVSTREPRCVVPSAAALTLSPALQFPLPPLPTPLPVAAAGRGQRQRSCPLRTWLRRTFPPIVLVGGTAAAKREVAALTGLTLASLFQPFNGEALAARLAAAAAVAPQHQKECATQLKQQQQQQESPQPETDQGILRPHWQGECSEDDFLSREGYHPSHVYRYGLLKTSGSSRTGPALSSSAPASAVQLDSSLPSRYSGDIPPLNLLLRVPASGGTRGVGAASDTASAGSGPAASSGSASSSTGSSSSSSAVASLSSSHGGATSDTAGDGTASPPAAAGGNADQTFAGSATPSGSIRFTGSSHDYFCVRFVDLEDAESPSPLAADALAMRALTQAPPPLQDLSTFAAAAGSSSSFAHSQHGAAGSPPSSPSRGAGRPPRPPETAETVPVPCGISVSSGHATSAISSADDSAVAGELRKSAVRSSAASPFTYPAEGPSVTAAEAAANCQPLASTTGCRGTDLLWFEEWERVLFDSLRFCEHETLSQPVGLVLVASSRDPDPAEQLQQLLQPQRLPSLCSRFVLDPNPVRAFVLLDIHPNALQARAALTSACLLRRRRPSSHQQPLWQRQPSSGHQILQSGLQQQQEGKQQGGAPQAFPRPVYRVNASSSNGKVDHIAACAAGRGEISNNSSRRLTRAAHHEQQQQQQASAADTVAVGSPLADVARASGSCPPAAPVGERATLRESIPSQPDRSSSESPRSATHRAGQECGDGMKGSSRIFAARWQHHQDSSSKTVQHRQSSKQGPSDVGETLRSSRGEELLEQLCAAFPPANCHLLTLGRATGSPAHWQLLPAIRFLYSQSLTPNFNSSLSAGRTPVMLSTPPNAINSAQISRHLHPPPFLPLVRSVGINSSHSRRYVACSDSTGAVFPASSTTGVPGFTGETSVEEEAAAAAVAATAEGVISAADIEWLLCSGYQLPVASRLTLPPAICNNSGGAGSSSRAHPPVRATQIGELTAEPAAAAAAALSSIENSFCVGLSWADLHALSAFVQHLVHTGVLPWVERKTQQLETAISSSRRGFRNQLRYLWRKPKASVAAASASSPGSGPGGTAASGGSGGAGVSGTARSAGGVVASAAEQATGAAEALLSAVGGALLGDAASSFYTSSGLLHLGGGSSSKSQQPAKSSSGGAAAAAEKAAPPGELSVLKARETTATSAKTSGTGQTAGPTASVAAPPTAYQLHTVEWQYRLQADLHFFLGNFEAALQSFRCCSADFKQDKRWPQLGGAYEMQALCLYLTGGSRREIDACIEHAYNAFVRAAAGRLALRCVLLGLRITMEIVAAALPLPFPWNPLSPLVSLRQRVHQLPPAATASAAAAELAAIEAARQLLAANVDLPSLDASAQETALLPPPSQQEISGNPGVSVGTLVPTRGGTVSPPLNTPAGVSYSVAAGGGEQSQQQHHAAALAFRAQSWAIRSAMLLEQAALCYEQAGISHRRKRNFQLVMAGHTYFKAGYKRLALRCYTAVVSQYEWCGWQHVAQHLRFIMARQAFSLHLLLDAVFHFAALLDAVACVHHIRRLVCGWLPSMSQKRAAVQVDNSSRVSSIFSSPTSSSSPSLLPFLSPAPATAYNCHATPAAAPTGGGMAGKTTTCGAAEAVLGSSAAFDTASLGLPEVSAEREAHYIREFVFVCRVILERQKQQLEQQEQHAARGLTRGGIVAAGIEKEKELQASVCRDASDPSCTKRLNAVTAAHCGASSTAVAAASPSGGQSVTMTAGMASGSHHSAAESTLREGRPLGKPSPAGAFPATLTLPVGLHVPYVECCNKQGLFRDAIEVRLQGDACLSVEESCWHSNDDSHPSSPFARDSVEEATHVTPVDKEVWATQELLQLREAINRSSGASGPLPVARLCELAQCLLNLPQTLGGRGGPKLLLAERQELELQEAFLNEASEAWIEAQLEATLARLSATAVSASGDLRRPAEGEDGDVDQIQGTPQILQDTCETDEAPPRKSAVCSELDPKPWLQENDDFWLRDQLRLSRSRTRATSGDTRGGKGNSSRDSTIYEQLTRRTPVGSPVHVLVCLVNPLQLPLDCRNVRLVGSIQTNTSSVVGPAAAAVGHPSLNANGRAGIPFSREAQRKQQQRKTKKIIEFPAIPTVTLAPLETVCLRLVAVPLVQGKLRIRGLSLDLFGFIRLTQPFCLHGSLRQERQYNLRHCRLFSSEDQLGLDRGAAGSGARAAGEGDRPGSISSACRTVDEAGESRRQQTGLSLSNGGHRDQLRQGLSTADSRCCWETEEHVPEWGGMPLSFIIRAESYKLLPTGLPIEALRWRFRQRALEIHKEDCRLQLTVDDALPLLSVSFLGWPHLSISSQRFLLRSSAARPSSADDVDGVAPSPYVGSASSAAPEIHRGEGSVVAECHSAVPVEKREMPFSTAAAPAFCEPTTSSDTSPESPPVPTSSPAAILSTLSAASARPPRSPDGALKHTPWQERGHLLVGERGSCVLRLSLAARSQPLHALSLAVSPATLVRFQSAVLLLPCDQRQQRRDHSGSEESTSFTKCDLDGYDRDLSHVSGEDAVCTETSSGKHTQFPPGSTDKSVPLLLREEFPFSSTETAGYQTMPVTESRSPAAAGPGSVSALQSRRSNVDTPMISEGGQSRHGFSRTTKESAFSEVEGASIQVVHLLRPFGADVSAGAGSSAATSGASVSESAGNGVKCDEFVVTGGSTVQVQLVLHALQPGVHRVRFCVKAVAAPALPEGIAASKNSVHGQQQHNKSFLKKNRPVTLWRGIEKILVVKSSLQLTVEPRLSWREPNRHLLLCRVKNLSNMSFCIEHLAAFLPSSSRGTQNEEETAAARCDICGSIPMPAKPDSGAQCPCCSSQLAAASLRQQPSQHAGAIRPQTRICDVKVLTLLPCSRRQQEPVIGPYETLHLLYAAEQQQQRRRYTPECEGLQQACEKQDALRRSRQPRVTNVSTSPKTASWPAVETEASDGHNERATLETGDLLESTFCAGTTIQVGLGWRLAGPSAPQPGSGGDSSERQQPQDWRNEEEKMSAIGLPVGVSLPAKAYSSRIEDHRAVPRGFVLATSPVELSPRLSLVPLRMQIVVCSPVSSLEQDTSTFANESWDTNSSAAQTWETEAPLACLRRRSSVQSGRFHLRNCCVRRVRFLLQNTSSSLLLRLQLLADLEAAAYALPLRLTPRRGAGPALSSVSPWDPHQPCWMGGISSVRCSLSSNTNCSFSTSAPSSTVGRDVKLQSPSEDPATIKLSTLSRGSDSGSTSSTGIASGSTGAGSFSMSSPGRFAAALIHRLPLAPSTTATGTSPNTPGGFVVTGGSSATTSTGSVGTGPAGGLLPQFLTPPAPTCQARSTAGTLHQQPAMECTGVSGSSVPPEVQQLSDLLTVSKLTPAVGYMLQPTGSSTEETWTRALLEKMQRQPQCCALPVVDSSVAHRYDAESSTAVSPAQADGNTSATRFNDIRGSSDQSQRLQSPTGDTTRSTSILCSAAGLPSWKSPAASLDIRDNTLEEQQLQPLAIDSRSEGVFPEVLDLPYSFSGRVVTGSNCIVPGVPVGSARSNRAHEGSSAPILGAAAPLAGGSRAALPRVGAPETVSLSEEGSFLQSSSHRGCCNGFYWIGRPEQHLGCVGPGQKVEASLLAFFPSFGVFNVNKVYVRVGVAGQVSSGRLDTKNVSAAACPENESAALQSQFVTDELCRHGGAASSFSVDAETLPAAVSTRREPVGGPTLGSSGSSTDGTDGKQEKHFVMNEKFFCNALTRPELQWETELARMGCEVVVCFPMECPVYIQPVANGAGVA